MNPVVPRPSAAELAILQALWEAGPSSVAQVRDLLGTGRPAGYTTVLKFLQIMHGKGMVQREKAGRLHVYRAAVEQSEVRLRLLDALRERAFRGSRPAMMALLMKSGGIALEELVELRALLDAEIASAAAKRRSWEP